MTLIKKRQVGILLLSAATAVIAKKVLKYKKQLQTRKRKIWAKQWLLRRNEGYGTLNMLENELKIEDPESYRNFIRMCEEYFEEILTVIEPAIKKEDTNMRESISPKQRLQLTLRYLAAGETYRSLMYATRIHESTISLIVPTVCKAIYSGLKEAYLKIPTSNEEWRKVAMEFEEQCNFPVCIGALDGKHINFQPPHSAGSYYYNYKGHHSIVLLAVCDANRRFLYVDVGVNGRNSDGGVFRNSDLKKAMDLNILNFPPDKKLSPNTTVPYVFVADDAFPLSERIMKPYSNRGLTDERRICNYRISRARICIENAFGILANRFRILLNTINLQPDKVEDIVLACCVLHNFLLAKNKMEYTRNVNANLQLPPLRQTQGGNRFASDALHTRNKLCTYFNTDGVVPWQTRCLNT